MKKYKIIYADPPWRYERSKVQGAAEKHYPTMSIAELCALPVKERILSGGMSFCPHVGSALLKAGCAIFLSGRERDNGDCRKKYSSIRQQKNGREQCPGRKKRPFPSRREGVF